MELLVEPSRRKLRKFEHNLLLERLDSSRTEFQKVGFSISDRPVSKKDCRPSKETIYPSLIEAKKELNNAPRINP